MGRPDYKRCKNCGAHADTAGELTHNRYCSVCWPAVQKDHNRQLEAHRGPAFESWRRKVAASVGAVILDDNRAKP